MCLATGCRGCVEAGRAASPAPMGQEERRAPLHRAALLPCQAQHGAGRAAPAPGGLRGSDLIVTTYPCGDIIGESPTRREPGLLGPGRGRERGGGLRGGGSVRPSYPRGVGGGAGLRPWGGACAQGACPPGRRRGGGAWGRGPPEGGLPRPRRQGRGLGGRGGVTRSKGACPAARPRRRRCPG